MKKLILVGLLALMPLSAHAGVKSALKVAGEQVAAADFVVSVNTNRSLEFLANRKMFDITSRLGVTAGVDIRSEFEFASGFSNLGIGGGLRFIVREPFSIHAGYSYRLTDFGVKTDEGSGKVFAGVGFHF